MWPLATQSNVLMTEQTETFCYSDEGVQGQRVGGEQEASHQPNDNYS